MSNTDNTLQILIDTYNELVSKYPELKTSGRKAALTKKVNSVSDAITIVDSSRSGDFPHMTSDGSKVDTLGLTTDSLKGLDLALSLISKK